MLSDRNGPTPPGQGSGLLSYLVQERAQGYEGGFTARELRDVVGGSYGGRSVAGELGRLERAGDVEDVMRTDGRVRPLLYRATAAATWGASDVPPGDFTNDDGTVSYDRPKGIL